MPDRRHGFLFPSLPVPDVLHTAHLPSSHLNIFQSGIFTKCAECFLCKKDLCARSLHYMMQNLQVFCQFSLIYHVAGSFQFINLHPSLRLNPYEQKGLLSCNNPRIPDFQLPSMEDQIYSVPPYTDPIHLLKIEYPGFFQSPVTTIMEPIIAGTPVV